MRAGIVRLPNAIVQRAVACDCQATVNVAVMGLTIAKRTPSCYSRFVRGCESGRMISRNRYRMAARAAPAGQQAQPVP